MTNIFAVAGRLASAFLILVGNSIPLVGVRFWGWNAFLVVYVYWLETWVVGLFVLLKILLTLPDYRPIPGRSVTYRRAGKHASHSFTSAETRRWLVIPSFVALYGGLTAFYGLFLFVFLAGGIKNLTDVLIGFSGLPGGLATVLLSLFAEHGWATYLEYTESEPWMRRDPIFHSVRPCGRFVLLHLVVLVGAFTTQFLGLSILYLALFVFLKTLAELFSAFFTAEDRWQRHPPLPE